MIDSHPIQTLVRSNDAPCLAKDPTAAALAMIEKHGVQAPKEQFDLDLDEADRIADATATILMDLYRRSKSSEVFEALVELTTPRLRRRVQSRLRYLGSRLDPQEVLQDAYINVYRYPDKFDGSRPGAFRAWSSTIVDNTIRRHLRRARSGVDIQLRPIEILAEEADRRSHEPSLRVLQREECSRALEAMNLFLACYLTAYQTLSERERFVLQMVEVKGMRYAELAKVLEIRPEALKMVVFRARRRIFERVNKMFCRGEYAAAS